MLHKKFLSNTLNVVSILPLATLLLTSIPAYAMEDREDPPKKISISQKVNKKKEIEEWAEKFFLQPSPFNLRFLHVWVAGEHSEYTSNVYIGRSPEEAEIFFDIVEGWSKGFKKANSGTLFTIEVVVDDPTHRNQKEQFKRLQENYSESFKITFVNDLKGKIPEDVLKHAYWGNPAFFSDGCRLFYLPDLKYEKNVYMDMDTLKDKCHNLDRYPDFNVFGREITEEGFYYNIEKESKGSSNDYLIESNAPLVLIEKLQTKGMESFTKNKKLFDYYLTRKTFVAFGDIHDESYNYYKEQLKNIVNYFRDQKTGIFDITTAIMRTFGPRFWQNSDTSPNQIVMDKNPSAGTWKGGQEVPVGGKYYSSNLLNELQIIKKLGFNKRNEEANMFLENLVKLHFMGLDYSYFSKFYNTDYFVQNIPDTIPPHHLNRISSLPKEEGHKYVNKLCSHLRDFKIDEIYSFSKYFIRLENFMKKFLEDMKQTWKALNLRALAPNQCEQVLGITGGVYEAVKILDHDLWEKTFSKNEM